MSRDVYVKLAGHGTHRSMHEQHADVRIRLAGHGTRRRDPVIVYSRKDKEFKEAVAAVKTSWETLCSFQGKLALSAQFKKELFSNKYHDHIDYIAIAYRGAQTNITGFAAAYVKDVKSELPPGLKLVFDPMRKTYFSVHPNGQRKRYSAGSFEKYWREWHEAGGRTYPSLRTLYVPVVCAQSGQGQNVIESLDKLARKLKLPSVSLRASERALVPVYTRYGFRVSLGCGQDGMTPAERTDLLNELNLRERGKTTHFGIWMTKCLQPSSVSH